MSGLTPNLVNSFIDRIDDCMPGFTSCFRFSKPMFLAQSFKALNKIPVEKHESVLKDALELLSSNPESTEYIKEILIAFSNVDSDKRKPFYEMCKRYFPEQFYLTMKPLSKIRPEYRQTLLESARILRPHAHPGQIYLLISAVAEIDHRKCAAVFEALLQIHSPDPFLSKFVLKYTVQLLTEMPISCLDKKIKQVVSFLKETSSPCTLAFITRYIAHDGMDRDLCKKVSEKLEQMQDEACFLENIQQAQALPPEERLKILAEAESLDNSKTHSSIISALGALLKADDPKTYAYLEECLDRYKESPESIPPISKAIEQCSFQALSSTMYDALSKKCKAALMLLQVPSERHDRLYELAKSLYPELSGCNYLLATVVKELSQVDEVDSSDFITCVRPFIKAADDDVLKILSIFRGIPAARRPLFMKLGCMLCGDATCMEHISQILHSLAGLQEDIQECVALLTAPFVPYVPTAFRPALLLALSQLDSHRRAGIANALLQAFKSGIVSKASQDEIAQAALILQDMPEDTMLQRVETAIRSLYVPGCPCSLQVLVQFTSCIFVRRLPWNCILLFLSWRNSSLLTLFRLLEFLPPEERIPAILKIDCSIKKFDIQHFIQERIRAIPKPRMYQFLQQMLEEHVGRRRLADFYAGSIIECIDLLKLEETNPLLQKAIEVQLTANNYEKINPYTLHNELRKEHENPPIDPATLTLKKTEHLGHKLSLNLTGIRAQAKKKWPPTLSDLPKGIAPDTLDTLFEALEKRVHGLSETQEYIQKHYGASPAHLKAYLLHKPLIHRLLNVNPDEKIEQAHVQLFTVVQLLLSYSDEVPPNALLSEREEFLLSIAKQLNECSVGQRDGLGILYNSLVYQKECTATLAFDSDFEGEFITHIHEQIQTRMNWALTSSALIQQLSGECNVAQLSHQSLYLKNRFCTHLGLKHTLCFDPHILTVPESLRRIPTKESLEHIVNGIDIVSLIHAMQEYITPLKKEVIYNTLVTLFEKMHNKPDNWLQKWLSFDEDLLFTGITEEGAICLLIHAQAIIIS